MLEYNEPQIDTRFSQWMTQRADARQRETVEELVVALQSGVITIPAYSANTRNYAGGTNYCPNSDMKYSKLAAEFGTPPSDEDYECWRFHRQPRDAAVDATPPGRLKSATHALYAASEGANSAIPVWNRTEGCLVFGSAGAEQFDVAVRLRNNHCNAAETWFVRFQMVALTPNLLPDDLEMYVGVWHKTATGDGWITGGLFQLDYRIIGVRGTRAVSYKIVARTDAGNELHSQILTIADAPNFFDEQNYPRINFADTSTGGFIEFDVYREINGDFQKIRTLRNANALSIDDDEENGADFIPVSGFPASSATVQTAIAYSSGLDVGAYQAAEIINDFRIDIPRGYNIGATLPTSQFLRFGFTRSTAVNRQIRLDKIWFSPSYNTWSESSLDPTGATPSSNPQNVPPPPGGGTTYPPNSGGGGSTCVLDDVPVLRLDFDRQREFVPYGAIPRGDVLESGARTTRKNLVLEKQTGASKVFWRVYFSNHSWIYVTRHHRFRVNKYYRSRSIEFLRTGDPVWGWTANGHSEPVEGEVTILFKELILVKKARPHGTFALDGESHFYIAGFSRNSLNGVFNKNSKPLPELTVF